MFRLNTLFTKENIMKIMEKSISEKNKVLVHSDGACINNPGKIGFSACIEYPNEPAKVYTDSEERGTNNIAELKAVILGAKNLSEGADVIFAVDSAYVANAFIQNWIDKWVANERNGIWRKPNAKGSKAIVKNQELWKELLKELSKLNSYEFKLMPRNSNQQLRKVDHLARQAAHEQDE